MLMRKLLRGFAAVTALALIACGIALWSNWAMVRSMATMKSRSVEILDGYTPVIPVKGAAVPAVFGAYDQPIPLPDQLTQAFDYSAQMGGLAMVVLVDGKIVRQAYADGFGPDSRFETFSMHKSVMGLLYGAALRDKIIGSIDDPIGNYIDEFKNDPRGTIPIRDFLTMESGLKFYSLSKQEWPAMKLVLSDQVSATALSIPADQPSGQTFEYYNVNSQIAGIALSRAIKRAGKGTYADYLSQNIWQKIGAADARLWIEHDGGDPRFFSGLQANVLDWAKVGQLIAQGGMVGQDQVIPSDWIAMMTAPSAQNPHYGMQIWRGSPWSAQRSYGANTPLKVPHKDPYAADDIVFFDGFGGQRLYVSPSLHLVIARIGRTRIDFDDSVIPNAVIRGLGLKP